uniref:Uncharacterized protein n=1 Tax=Pipistrellus kuhlii TaxID=59472 RepID=A0A7J7X0U5_PIPKU|nr:hypothetical protein mPipKuh1_010793 [Pipistrellus kuhlii]
MSGSFCVPPGWGAARTRGCGRIPAANFSVLASDGVAFSGSKQAWGSGWRPRAAGPPLCSPADSLSGLLGAPDGTGRGPGIQTVVAPHELWTGAARGFCCSGERLSGRPCREAHLPETGWFSLCFALSHLGPRQAVAFTQRALLGGQALPGSSLLSLV